LTLRCFNENSIWNIPNDAFWWEKCHEMAFTRIVYTVKIFKLIGFLAYFMWRGGSSTLFVKGNYEIG
jgi:hypothetical protein